MPTKVEKIIRPHNIHRQKNGYLFFIPIHINIFKVFFCENDHIPIRGQKRLKNDRNHDRQNKRQK